MLNRSGDSDDGHSDARRTSERDSASPFFPRAMLATVLTSLAGRDGRGALPRWVLPLVFGFALAMRLAVSTHPHSGEGVPPMFGDFEAQRHWMEITIHTPLREWYVSTKANDLKYWGLDYPPLTAYQSWFYGKCVAALEPEAVRLTTSRGYETDSSKRIMRYSVIVSDAVFLLPAAYAFVRAWYGSGVSSRRTRRTKKSARVDAKCAWAFATFATAPAQILIDHGHFQYNGISLGLTMYAVAAVLRDRDVLGSILFVCALNHKQMSLYFAPAFFAHLLGKSLARNKTFRLRCLAIAKLGVTVVVAFAIIWAPFFLAIDPKTNTRDGLRGVVNVLARLAPLERGLYEDYVANFWCATNPLFRWRRRMANGTAARAALAATVAAIAPSVAHQIRNPSKEGFLWCMFNCASGFFLFSFQAHEKSALLPLLPALALAPVDPDLAAWFPIVVSLSMWPLLRKDRLHVAYVAMVVAFAALADGGAPGEEARETMTARATTRGGRKKTLFAFFSSFASLPRGALWRYVRVATFVGAAGLHGLEVFVPPPARFPYLHDLLVTSFCFALFAGAAAYGNKRQRLVSPDVDAKARAPPRATRASRRAQPAVADEWSLVRIAATPEPKTTRRQKPSRGGKR